MKKPLEAGVASVRVRAAAAAAPCEGEARFRPGRLRRFRRSGAGEACREEATRIRGGPREVSDAFKPIAGRLIGWYARHGRRDLPWQHDPTPYRVWVSEIMLQQTRVSVVTGYYERFMARFPDLAALADAPLDDVLGLWTGLGYYSRARNLHRAAMAVRDRHRGTMPRDVDALVALPGIGRSTAGAILALSHGDRHPILDGNVKRVLCRYHGIAGWPGQGKVERSLWALAERHTPREDVAAYTQAIMDLGATLCVRSRPLCSICPIEADCAARRDGTQARLPAPRPRPRRDVPRRETAFLVLRAPDGALLLERRPPSGIWGGLWCFPECDPAADIETECRSRFGVRPLATTALAPIAHGFTHFKLDVHPVLVEVDDGAGVVAADAEGTRRYTPGAATAGAGGSRRYSPGAAAADADGSRRYSPGADAVDAGGSRRYTPGAVAADAGGSRRYPPGAVAADAGGSRRYPPAASTASTTSAVSAASTASAAGSDGVRRHSSAHAVADAGELRWYAPGAAAGVGLAAPVKRLIEQLAGG